MLEFVRMSDLLRIPDDKRAYSGRISLFEAPERPLSFWIIVAIAIGLNVWFDYYHPSAIPIGIIIAIIFVARSH
jgi:hypothetical protein